MLQENQVFFEMSCSGQSKMLPGVLLPHERHPNRESPPPQLQNSHCCSWHGNAATPACTNTCTDLQTTQPAERGAELMHPSPRAAWQRSPSHVLIRCRSTCKKASLQQPNDLVVYLFSAAQLAPLEATLSSSSVCYSSSSLGINFHPEGHKKFHNRLFTRVTAT